MKLYDIPLEANEIEEKLHENIGELTPELEQRILAFLAQGKDKIESAAIVVNSLEEDAEICQDPAAKIRFGQQELAASSASCDAK